MAPPLPNLAHNTTTNSPPVLGDHTSTPSPSSCGASVFRSLSDVDEEEESSFSDTDKTSRAIFFQELRRITIDAESAAAAAAVAARAGHRTIISLSQPSCVQLRHP